MSRTYEIWHIQENHAFAKYRFLGLSMLPADDQTIPQNRYEKVYGPILSEESVDDLFSRFNSPELRPTDYHSYSLSVSDVVLIRNAPDAGAYFCNSIGWLKLPDWV